MRMDLVMNISVYALLINPSQNFKKNKVVSRIISLEVDG